MNVLKAAYDRIYNLKEYLNATLEDASEKLAQYSERPGFQIILRKTIIAVSSDKPLSKCTPSPCTCDDEQMQVVEEVVQEILNGGKKSNVLTFDLKRGDASLPVVPFFPDHNYTQFITPFWSRILRIIGTNAMKELLHNTSIFIEAQSACYIQLSGDPVHTVITKSHISTSTEKNSSIPPFKTNHKLVVESTDTISALSLCYDKSRSHILKRSHPLNSLSASNAGTTQLVYQIFQKQKAGRISKSKMKRIPDRLRRSKNLLRQLLKNFKKVRLEVFPKAKYTGTEVYVSLRGLLKKIIPNEIWGSTYNENAFYKYVHHLVKLGRHEKLPLNLLKNCLRISDCDWTRSKNEDWVRVPRSNVIKRRELVQTMYVWMITDLLIPLIRLQYYVTETSTSKNELAYYPKHEWIKMEEAAISDYRNLGVVTELDKEAAMAKNILQKTLGISKLRFLPKEKGLRPIVRFRKSSLPGKENYDINFLLKDIMDVLNYLWRDHPQLFGYSLLGVSSIFPKWKQFVVQREQESNSRPLYFVKTDITKCYDSIPHNKLLEVITGHLKQKDLSEKYTNRRYRVTTMTRQGYVRNTLKSYTTPEDGKYVDPRSFHQILLDLINDGGHPKSIITNQSSLYMTSVDKLLNLLERLIHYDIFRINKRDFLRTKGISQGSVVSSLLCSIFYGYMEKQCLTDVDEDGLLMRIIDDYLFVTPHLDRATKFIQTLFSAECSGVFGCCINPSKTLTNFKYVYNGQQLQQLIDEDWFPWCGLLFNMKTLEVKNDYQRYEAKSFRYSMTVAFTASDIMKAMKGTLSQALLQLKGFLIYIDPLINSSKVVIENVYNHFLLTAFRFHSYFQALPHQLRPQDSSSLLDMILDFASLYYFKAKKSLQRLSKKLVFTLNLTAVMWLCVKAFHIKLSRHVSIHWRLVVRLRQKRRALARKLSKDMRKALAEGSIPDIPAAFIKTKR